MLLCGRGVSKRKVDTALGSLDFEEALEGLKNELRDEMLVLHGKLDKVFTLTQDSAIPAGLRILPWRSGSFQIGDWRQDISTNQQNDLCGCFLHSTKRIVELRNGSATISFVPFVTEQIYT